MTDSHYPFKDQDNVIHFQRRTEKKLKPPPAINLPPACKYTVAALLLIHVLIYLGDEFFYEGIGKTAADYFGFTPGAFSGDSPHFNTLILTPFTYFFIHGGWLHLIINVIMLASFGSAVERIMGAKWFLLIMAASSLVAALVHFLIFPHEIVPMVGASGGISGIFGALLWVMPIGPQQSRLRMVLTVITIWVVISVITGFLGGPNGESVAWVAHIAGFFAGLAITTLICRKLNFPR